MTQLLYVTGRLLDGLDERHYWVLRSLVDKTDIRGNPVNENELTLYRIMFLAESSHTIVKQTISWLLDKQLVVCILQGSKTRYHDQYMDTFEITKRGRALPSMIERQLSILDWIKWK